MPLKKVLLAEDDSDDRHLFHIYLNDRNDIILMPIAENGVEVFDILNQIGAEQDLPDLIVLDQNMPQKKRYANINLIKIRSKIFSHPGSNLFYVYR